jgi:dTDP-4-amino-4,6-dideoxygalactose transaminase
MKTMNIGFTGLDRLYNAYSWRLTRRAKAVWKTGKVVIGRHVATSEVAQFENNIAKYTKREYGVAVGSGTDALYFALKTKGIGPGKNVLCPAISFIATAEAIKRTGANVEFIDVDDNGQIGTLTPINKVDAVVYVNLFGNLANYDQLKRFCEERKVPLIEDAAQSLGSFYKKIPSGKLGDISILSFAPTKPLPSFGSGGMVLCDTLEEANEIRAYRYHGTGPVRVSHGYLSLLSEDRAIMLNFLLSKYKRLLKKRARVRKWYDKNLENTYIQTISSAKNTISNNHKLVIKVTNRDELQIFLANKGIETQIHYKKPMSEMHFFKKDPLANGYLRAEGFCKQVISLPIYPHLTKEEVEYICKCIEEYYGL